jgi:hypothetical protein
MDRLDDEDIGIIWGRHYPKRTEHASSMSLCLTLAMIIKQRAKSLDQYSDWPAKLEHALAAGSRSKRPVDTLETEPRSSVHNLRAVRTSLLAFRKRVVLRP